VSQEKCARLREGVPYVKVCRYNQKHLCPKLNGYGDKGPRTVRSSGGSKHYTCQLTGLISMFDLEGGTRHVRHYLDESFPNRWLGRGGPVAWTPRSPDLTPLDYYLWGHMKTLVYKTKVDSREALRDRIFAAAGSYFCSGRAHTSPSRQHCFCYPIPSDACRKLHYSWRRTL
jgi:hypothetical protein